ncbi:Dihydrolipoyllysine-residue succinyltransferase component of 2-oxoglutarate dehydrogenase complex [Candidatus Erwinia haradaeae]|uniref:Dihydrolipoyllysine-residue succinyltransferase n=1 Tax=Candidatus Erwinia haradaeae TaxID=1922217 RepID=A0A451DDL9_9GAMM|nr:dihydrolipoyllysine-residue succinyltransferase [Candidatus Erwinia haradaeae]VFP84585.1 Dihydrolipoyllysine-residue succinyltransferase component of 2-oxoglutarate dehydrogenase complex [Candidatus Erwinia haradaeae]
MNTIDIIVPDLPESVTDATVSVWHKNIGDTVQRDEVLVDIETDKVVLEIPASADGILENILEQEGVTVISRQILGHLTLKDHNSSLVAPHIPEKIPTITEQIVISSNEKPFSFLSPAKRRLMSENNTKQEELSEEGINRNSLPKANYIENTIPQSVKTQDHIRCEQESHISFVESRSEKRIPMTRLRTRMVERLLHMKHTTAMLTTFNEVNMQPIMTLRTEYGESFEKRHGIRLGFMSFYIKAAINALKRYPEINASIDGAEIVYHSYFDISIAVSTPRGLVTPVLKNVDTLSMSEIEKQITLLATKSRNNKLTVEELTGGTFTITNGGVFGSLMSTPLLNPPQSAILGIHSIKERPVALSGKVVILPMMYLALSYDHRLIDGRESVGFLVTIKEFLEDPTRLLLDV